MVLEVIETESHFFSENIYLNRTERLRKVRTEDNTGVIRSQSSRSKKWIFLLDQGRDPFNQNFRKFRSKTQWIGSVQPEKFRKTGPPFEVDHFTRSDRLEFWLNGSRPRSCLRFRQQEIWVRDYMLANVIHWINLYTMVNAYSTGSVGVFFRRAKVFARESAMLKL